MKKENTGTIINKCCCCGGDVITHWEGYSNKAFAEMADVCGKCFNAGCNVLSGDKCNITDKIQKQLIK
jgi:hypothetical protein